MIAIAGKDTSNILNAVKLVEEQMDELKVYHCLKLPLYLYLNDEDKIMELQNSLDWLNFDMSLERAKCIVEKLK
ncbi:hypothetical protein JQK62_21655 [Leptospira santarosai]|nr:hypothetical protein [Leptospira santarosai]